MCFSVEMFIKTENILNQLMVSRGKLHCTITKAISAVGGKILIWITIVLEENTLTSFKIPDLNSTKTVKSSQITFNHQSLNYLPKISVQISILAVIVLFLPIHHSTQFSGPKHIDQSI